MATTKLKSSHQVRNDLYREVTEKIVRLLHSHELAWNKPWVTIGTEKRLPFNATNGRSYHGVNLILLSLIAYDMGYPYQGWVTYLQARKMDGQVKKGEKGCRVYYTDITYRDRNGRSLKKEDVSGFSKEKMESLGIRKFPFLKQFVVFNISQTQGLPEELYKVTTTQPLTEPEKDDRAETLILNTGAHLRYQTSNRAFYSPHEDIIYLPLREQFTGKEAYYETLLHELGHWSGHESRLDRKLLSHATDKKAYAKEELVAELCSAFLCAHCKHPGIYTLPSS